MSAWDIFGIGGAFLTVIVYVGYLIWQARRGPRERLAEEAARERFSRTGRWD